MADHYGNAGGYFKADLNMEYLNILREWGIEENYPSYIQSKGQLRINFSLGSAGNSKTGSNGTAGGESSFMLNKDEGTGSNAQFGATVTVGGGNRATTSANGSALSSFATYRSYITQGVGNIDMIDDFFQNVVVRAAGTVGNASTPVHDGIAIVTYYYEEDEVEKNQETYALVK